MRYVQITREELEEWLDRLGYPWSRDNTKAGIYFIHLSKLIAVKLSSSIGSRGEAMGRGNASMNLSLVSLVTGQLLNKKDRNQKLFQRSTNWRDTWKKGVEHWNTVYSKTKSFYDSIAPIEDREKYKKSMLSRIESIPGFSTNDFLKSLHQQVGQGRILSPKQEAAIEKAPQADEELLEVLRKLWKASDARNRPFVQSVGEQLKSRGRLSPKQMDVVNKLRAQYKVGSLHRDYNRLRGTDLNG